MEEFLKDGSQGLKNLLFIAESALYQFTSVDEPDIRIEQIDGCLDLSCRTTNIIICSYLTKNYNYDKDKIHSFPFERIYKKLTIKGGKICSIKMYDLKRL